MSGNDAMSSQESLTARIESALEPIESFLGAVSAPIVEIEVANNVQNVIGAIHELYTLIIEYISFDELHAQKERIKKVFNILHGSENTTLHLEFAKSFREKFEWALGLLEEANISKNTILEKERKREAGKFWCLDKSMNTIAEIMCMRENNPSLFKEAVPKLTKNTLEMLSNLSNYSEKQVEKLKSYVSLLGLDEAKHPALQQVLDRFNCIIARYEAQANG